MKLPWTLRRQHRKSPYLIEGRLADVLAAIQVLGSAKRPEAAISKFAHDLDGRAHAVNTQRGGVGRRVEQFVMKVRRCTEGGDAPGWQGATTEDIGNI